MPATPENPRNDGQHLRRAVVKTFAVCTVVVVLLGLAISVACAVIVAVGWNSLRAGTGDESTFGTIYISTKVSHSAYWLTAILSVFLYVATLLLKMRKPADASRRVTRNGAWKA